MKLDLLKKLIKEAVSEAVREELSKILSEDVKPVQTLAHTVTKYENYRPTKSTYVSTGDPMADLLHETKASMNQNDYRNIAQVSGIQPQMDEYPPGPEPGLDISQFDFMMKAGAIYKASNEKDRQRFGA